MSGHRLTKFLFALLLISLLIVPVLANTTTFQYPYTARILNQSATQSYTLDAIKDGVGTSVQAGGVTYLTLAVLLGASNTSGEFNYSTRYGISFNTSTLPDNVTISSAKLQLWGEAYPTNGLGSNWGLVVTPFTPASNTSFVVADFNRTEDTEWSNIVNQASLSQGVYKNLTLNTLGISNISKTGRTVMYVRSTYDVKGFNGTWLNNGKSYWIIQAYSHPPQLVVEWNYPEVPVSNFTSNVVTGVNPTTVTFTDTSTGYPDTFNWTFGDGETSTDQNPSHTYTSLGTYNVTHGVSNSLGSDVETKTDYISITPPPPAAAFSGYPVYGSAPMVVTFTDASTNTPSSWLWNFGDSSSENSTQQNPVHTYAVPGKFTVSLTATNAYGSDVESKSLYVWATGTATRGDHPYLFFHNITELDSFTYRESYPYSSWESTIKTNKANLVDGAIYYHLCTALNYTGCSYYVNRTVTKLLVTPNITSTTVYNGYLYAMAYDIIAGVNKTDGLTTFDDANDTLIRNRLAVVADNAYHQALAPSKLYEEDYPDGKGQTYPTIWIMGEVLYDYDTTGRGLTSTPADWISLGTDQWFTKNTLVAQSVQDYGGLFYASTNKTTGMLEIGDYLHYVLQYQAYTPVIYSRIYGNITDLNPGYKKYMMGILYGSYPNNIGNGYITAGEVVQNPTTTGLQYLTERERSWLRWFSKNSSEMYGSVLHNESGHYYTSDYLSNYLTRQDYSSESVYMPVHKNWMGTTYSTLRTEWGEMGDMLSITARAVQQYDTRYSAHQDQLGIDIYGHGDQVLPDGGEVKILRPPSGVGFSEFEDIKHNILMFERPGTPLPVAFHTNTSIRGAAAPQYEGSNAYLSNQIDSPGISYIKGNMAISKVAEAMQSPTSIGSTIYWTREVITPQNEYFVITDRATSPATWIYQSHWNFASQDGLDPQSSTSIAGLKARVNGTLTIGDTPYDWFNQTFAYPINTTIKTNKITWNTTNERNRDISTELFSVPESFITSYRFVVRSGGYTPGSSPASAPYNHEWSNPHIFYTSPENSSLYRITAALISYANDTSVRVPSELAVTGTGSALQVIGLDGVQTDYYYTGIGVSNFSTFQTDADTVFVRKSNATTIQSYLIVNGTYLLDGSKVFESNKTLNYISVNKTSLTGGKFNVSGTGATSLIFYNVPTVSNMTQDSSSFSSWSMAGSTLTVTATLSDHFFEYGTALEGYPDEGPGTFMYNETEPLDPEPPTATFYLESTNEDSGLRRTAVDEDWSTIISGDGNDVYLTNTTHTFIGMAGSTTNNQYAANVRNGYCFNTSEIPDNATVTSSYVSIYGSTGGQTALGSLTATITGFHPDDPQSLTAADYNKTDQNIYTTNISYSTWSTVGYNNFVFENLTAINSTGYTCFVVRSTKDVDGVAPTWSSGAVSVFRVTDYSDNNEGTQPKLNVFYTVPSTDAPVSSFVMTPNGSAPFYIGFYDNSTNTPTIWNWSFGDGNYSSFQNPYWMYNSAGTYNVSLYVENDIGNDTSYQDLIITVGTPVSNFTADKTTVRVPGTVTFTDLSTGASSWNWSFGDGSYSEGTNPSHTYTKRGVFNVSNTVFNAEGSGVSYQLIRVMGYEGGS
jgi:PKD repeat protein